MTVSQVGEEVASELISGPALSTGSDADPHTTALPDLSEWQVEFREGLTGKASADGEGSLVMGCTGDGDAVITAPAPIPVPTDAIGLQVTVRSAGATEA